MKRRVSGEKFIYAVRRRHPALAHESVAIRHAHRWACWRSGEILTREELAEGDRVIRIFPSR